jgi:ABC-type branched-subunit amino acid transport system ATPase component
VAVVLVEQRVAAAMAVADWVYVLAGGTVELQGPAREVAAREDIGSLFLGARGRQEPADRSEGAKDEEQTTP